MRDPRLAQLAQVWSFQRWRPAGQLVPASPAPPWPDALHRVIHAHSSWPAGHPFVQMAPDVSRKSSINWPKTNSLPSKAPSAASSPRPSTAPSASGPTKHQGPDQLRPGKDRRRRRRRAAPHEPLSWNAPPKASSNGRHTIPCSAAAQDAEMSLEEYEDFCL